MWNIKKCHNIIIHNTLILQEWCEVHSLASKTHCSISTSVTESMQLNKHMYCVLVLTDNHINPINHATVHNYTNCHSYVCSILLYLRDHPLELLNLLGHLSVILLHDPYVCTVTDLIKYMNYKFKQLSEYTNLLWGLSSIVQQGIG